MSAGNPLAEASQSSAGAAQDLRAAEAHYEEARALLRAGHHDEAWRAAQASLQRVPHVPQTHVLLALLLQGRGRPTQAIAHLRSALQLNPGLPEAWINLGLAWLDCGDAELAAAALREALALSPGGGARAASNLLFTLQYQDSHSLDELRRQAQALGRHCGQAEALPVFGPREADRRLRLGYLGSGFHRHPVGSMALPALLAHDPARIDVHYFHDHDGADALTDTLRRHAAHWHPVAGLDDTALRNLIIGQRIDVLVDLQGHTQGGRPGVFARRAAPVQIAWLGYAASTGLAAMDYCIVGDSLAPAGAEMAFTESLLRLPRPHFCFLPPDYAPPVSPPPCERRGHVTFGSFNNSAKLNPTLLRAWSRILSEVPDSRLLLKSRALDDPALAARIATGFAQAGVDPTRIICRGASPHAEMLAEYADLDIALDPFPFTGGLSTCEALWMGVPVISLYGLRPLSRQGLAILQTLDLEWLCASTIDAYVRNAVALARDTGRLRELRGGLRDRMCDSALLDGSGLARELENTFLNAHTENDRS